jgi:hypothetical protein
MSNRDWLAAAFVAALVAEASQAESKSITLPPDGAQLTASGLTGYALARALCAACHSAEYMLYQPASAPRAFWDATVKRMNAIFNAQIDDADVPAIVDYLAKTYGQPEDLSRP